MPSSNNPTLKRSIGPLLLTLYGLGTILGAGIYVLVGEVARASGAAAPSAFLMACVLAGVTAFSYAELSSRLPESAGEAAYVNAGLRAPRVATAVGWGVIATGVVSAATLARGFVGYLQVFGDFAPTVVIVVLITVLGALAAWGIRSSLVVAGGVTLLEVAGLVLVCVVAGDSLRSLPERWPSLLPGLDAGAWLGVVSGAFVAFYAFIGFEDMVNVAEEVRTPQTTLPRAIVAALGLSTALYLLVATVAVLSLSQEALIGSGAPLVSIVEARGFPPWVLGLIGMLAVVNGALVQLIMASRVLYGLGSRGLTWPILARVHRRTRTPLLATALVSVAILLSALALTLDRLARLTSFIVLVIFVLVNVSLWRLKREPLRQPPFEVTIAVPVTGALLCTAMLFYQTVDWLTGVFG